MLFINRPWGRPMLRRPRYERAFTRLEEIEAEQSAREYGFKSLTHACRSLDITRNVGVIYRPWEEGFDEYLEVKIEV